MPFPSSITFHKRGDTMDGFVVLPAFTLLSRDHCFVLARAYGMVVLSIPIPLEIHPMPLSYFHAFPLPELGPIRSLEAKDLLQRVFGLKAFRGVQEHVIGKVMTGQDVLALMPTGGGKSLCYQIPALSLQGTAIVVSPLQALMRDQVDALRRKGVRAAALVSGDAMNFRERLEIESSLASGTLDIIYVSPEKLGSVQFLSMIQGIDLSLVAIDEAHCVCEWGHDFRPDYLQVAEVLSTLPRVPRIALTASASVAVREEIRSRLLAPSAQIVVGGFDRDNLSLSVVERTDLFGQLLELLRSRLDLGDALVYCPSRAQVDDLAKRLGLHGIEAEAYHAGLDGNTRKAVQDRFLNGSTRVVVATSAFGMGIDKPDIATVAHVALPASVEAYYQEIGRSGRDGRQALAWMAFARSDIGKRSKAGELGQEIDAQRRERARIETVMGYIEAPVCRRNSLLVRFGETFASGCGRCDLCLSPKPLSDASEHVREVLRMVEGLAGSSGVSVISEALAGVASDRVVSAGGNDPYLPFGALSSMGPDQVKRLVRQCLGLGLLEVDDRSAAVRPTEAGSDIEYSGEKVMLPGMPGQRLARRGVDGDGLVQWRIDLWKALHALRKEEATRLGVGDREVLSDKAMATVVSLGAVNEMVPESLRSGFEEAVKGIVPPRMEAGPGIDTGLF